jgi:hypothetical protein
MQYKKGEGPLSFTALCHLILATLLLASCSTYISVHLELLNSVSRLVGPHATSQRL